MISFQQANEEVADQFEEHVPSNIKPRPWEVADVSYGKKKMGELEYLQKMGNFQIEYLKNDVRISKGGDADKIAQAQEKLCVKFDEIRDKYNE